MTRLYVWRDSFTCVTWLVFTWGICDVTVVCVWRDECMCMTWLIHVECMSEWAVTSHRCAMTRSRVRHVWHDSFVRSTCLTWLIHMCDMTNSYLKRTSFTCVTWLIHACDMTHSYAWQDLFTCWKWLIPIGRMPDSYARYLWNHSIYLIGRLHPSPLPDPLICVSRDSIHVWLFHLTGWLHPLDRLTCSCGVTHSFVWRDSLIRCGVIHFHRKRSQYVPWSFSQLSI